MSQQQQQGGGGGGGGSEDSLDILWMIVILVVGLGLTWYFGRTYISAFVFQVRLIEITFIQFFIDLWSMFASLVHLPLPDTTDLTEVTTFIKAQGTTKEFAVLSEVSVRVGNYLRYPVVILMGLLAVLVYKKNVTARFNHKFDMRRLRKQEVVNWPYIIPVVKLNLVKKDLDDGPWASSLTPLLFAKKHDLLREKKKKGEIVRRIHSGAAHRVFAMQLGAVFTGIANLPPHMQALFAIFAAKANHDSQLAKLLLKEIAVASASLSRILMVKTT